MHADDLNIFDVFILTTKSTKDTNPPVVGHGFAYGKGLKPQIYTNPPVVGHVHTDILNIFDVFDFDHKEYKGYKFCLRRGV